MTEGDSPRMPNRKEPDAVLWSGRATSHRGPLAHPEEQETFNLKVPGSRPGRPTTYSLVKTPVGTSVRRIPTFRANSEPTPGVAHSPARQHNGVRSEVEMDEMNRRDRFPIRWPNNRLNSEKVHLEIGPRSPSRFVVDD